MTNEHPHIGLEAAILRCGYSAGFYTNADVERWAEGHIDTSDAPPLALIELATLRGRYPVDVMDLLRSLGSAPANTVIETQIGFVGVLHVGNRMSLEGGIHALYALTRDEGMTEEQRSMIFWLDDAYDLAVAGTWGTLAHVESEFRKFVQPYCDKVTSLHVQMFAKGNGPPDNHRNGGNGVNS